MLLVVAYDVPSDRRRARLHTLLLGFGRPVQESVFECIVDTAGAARLKRKVRAIARARDDNVRYYALCEACAERVETLTGVVGDAEPVAFVV